MEFTGERVVPGQTDVDLMNEHLARYGFAESLVAGKRVLDAGCGVGYGSARLARSADHVVGFDNAREPLLITQHEYGDSHVRLAEGDCRSLPFSNASFDVVVAFEVIEHVENWRGLLAEARRVLTPGGRLLVSTPNKVYYQQTRTTPNLYHVHEFDYDEFRGELAKFFKNTTMFLENHSDAITFTPLEAKGVRTFLEETSSHPEEAHFFVAVCSAEPLYGSPAFVYLPTAGNVLHEREQHIDLLLSEVGRKQELLKELGQEMRRLQGEHREQQQQARQAIEKLEGENERKTVWVKQLDEKLAHYEQHLEETTQWALNLQNDLNRGVENYRQLEAHKAEKHQELEKCVGLLDDAEQRVIERTNWAKRVDQQLGQVREQLTNVYASPAYRVGRRLRLAPEVPAGGQSPPAAPEAKDE